MVSAKSAVCSLILTLVSVTFMMVNIRIGYAAILLMVKCFIMAATTNAMKLSMFLILLILLL